MSCNRQNKTDRIRNLNSIWQCPDCGFYDKQTERLQPGQSYEVLKTKAASSINECPNPECKSKNFAAVVSEEDVEPFNDNNIIGGKKEGKFRHILLEGKPHDDLSTL